MQNKATSARWAMIIAMITAVACNIPQPPPLPSRQALLETPTATKPEVPTPTARVILPALTVTVMRSPTTPAMPSPTNTPAVSVPENERVEYSANPCLLVTRGEAEAALGPLVSPPDPVAFGSRLLYCSYVAQKGNVTIRIFVEPTEYNATQLYQTFVDNAQARGQRITVVTQVAERAAWTQTPTSQPVPEYHLFLQNKNTVLDIIVTGTNADSALSIARTFAGHALSRTR